MKKTLRLAFFRRAEGRVRRRCREAGLLMQMNGSLGSFTLYDGFSIVRETVCSQKRKE